MPGEDGYELIRKVRASSQQDVARLPAMALTAYARAEERAQAFAAGFQSHMTKPVEPAELIVTIARMLEEAEQTEVWGNHRRTEFCLPPQDGGSSTGPLVAKSS